MSFIYRCASSSLLSSTSQSNYYWFEGAVFCSHASTLLLGLQPISWPGNASTCFHFQHLACFSYFQQLFTSFVCFFRPCFIADLLLISCLVLLDKKSHSRYWWWQNDHLVIISALKGRVIGALEAWKFLHKPNF